MITRFVALLLAVLALSFPAMAEVARVKSGEHADFTRLVIGAPGVKDWTFGRTEDGYALRLDSAAWDYDATGVFDLIPRNRLASLGTDKRTGTLLLGIACACHAIPFEFRPGLIVVDLRDGPPPKGSSFELSLPDLNQTAGAFTTRRPLQRPRNRQSISTPGKSVTYNWLDGLKETQIASAQPSPITESLAPSGGESLDPLRQALLAKLSIGLSDGTVDLAEPGRRPPRTIASASDTDWSRVVLGELPEATANLEVRTPGPMKPPSEKCIPDERLSLHEWGSAEPSAGTFGEVRQGLLGEFDRPDAAAVLGAARKLIYLGFGAEAAQLLEAFPPEGPQPDRSILLSLARLVDGKRDADGSFANMAHCDSTAALWAALSSDTALTQGTVNDQALRRGFSALPQHLRRALGPGLIERFLETGNHTNVTALREAMVRGGNSDDPAILVLDARIDLSEGHAETAEKRAAEALAGSGPATAEAIIALVDAQVSQNVVVSDTIVTAVEALLEEQGGTAREPDLRRALVLARFGAGDVAGAFAALPDATWATEQAWALLAERGGDSDLLVQAVVPDVEGMRVAPETAATIAERLLGLGLAEQALRWIGEPSPDWTGAQHLLRGRALLSLGDAQAAIAALTDQSSPDAAIILAKAMSELGMEHSAAKAFDAAGQQQLAAAARSLAEDWGDLAKAGPPDWQNTAQRLTAGRVETIDPGSAGALGRGASLLDNSTADRASVEALLQAVPMPETLP